MLEAGGNYLIGQGILGIILVVLAVAIWKIMMWAKLRVVEPMVQSHMELIKTLQEHAPRQTAAINHQTEALAEIARHQHEIMRAREHPGGPLP